MTKEELKKHCEKQITLCLALNDYKHAEEHQVVLDILEQNKKYKEVIDKANRKLTNMFDNGDDNKILDDLLELSKILEVE